MDDFAAVIDNIPKIVFSRTLDSVDWKSARLANQTIEKDILELKQQSGKDIAACRCLKTSKERFKIK